VEAALHKEGLLPRTRLPIYQCPRLHYDQNEASSKLPILVKAFLRCYTSVVRSQLTAAIG